MSNAEHVTAPQVGKTNVVAVSTTATAAIDSGVERGSQFITIISSVRLYVVFAPKSDTTSLPAPDETQTSGTQRCWEIPPDTEWHRELSPESRYFRLKGASSANARWQLSSPIEG